MMIANWDQKIVGSLDAIVKRFLPRSEYKLELHHRDAVHIIIYQEHQREFNPITGDLYDIQVVATQALQEFGIKKRVLVYTQPFSN